MRRRIGVLVLAIAVQAAAAPAWSATTGSRDGVARALDAYVAGEEAAQHLPARLSGAVHSAPVPDGRGLVALAAFTWRRDAHPVQVLSYGQRGWTVFARLGYPEWPPTASYNGLPLTDYPVQAGDVAGRNLAFLVRLQGGDTQPGFVVSDSGGTWHYMLFAGPYPTSDVVGRNPSFQRGRMTSQYNNCTPDCAAGHVYEIVWVYRPPRGDFWAPDPPGWTPAPGTENYRG